MSATMIRLLAVLELVQSREEITGAEIAERLNVDRRSVRRYIKSIQDMGIPIEAERGRHGAYRLERGYKLPPLMFNEREIIALILGLMMIRAYRFPLDSSSIAGAIAKIERTIPEQFLDQLQSVQEMVHFNPIIPAIDLDEEIMEEVAIAARTQNRINMTYVAWNDQQTEREYDAYGIVYKEGYWYTAGYCHLRQDYRTFRIDRIIAVQTLSQTFIRPHDFNALEHVLRTLNQPKNIEQVKVLFMTTLDIAKKSLPAELGQFEETDEGVLFIRPAYRLEWIAPMLLSLDFPIKILQPQALKDEINALAQKALNILADDSV